MTATDDVRRLLDERGVEWIHGRLSSDSTAWLDGDIAVVADEYGDGLLLVERKMTPEQAVEATLGRGTCKVDETDTWECVRDDLGGYGKTLTVHVMECTECGHTYEHVNGSYEFCPRCGRKVVDA